MFHCSFFLKKKTNKQTSTTGCTKCFGCPPGQEADRMGAQNCTYCQKGTQFKNVNFILVLF